jgi:Zinc knuckle
VTVIGIVASQADGICSVRKQSPGSVRPAAAWNILLEIVPRNVREHAEIGMLSPLVQGRVMLKFCSGSEDHMAKECDKPRPCNNCDQPGHTAR